jgi:16S rRNA (uracil1498-N3)-methyltransferase
MFYSAELVIAESRVQSAEFFIDCDEFHHIVNVFRHKIGDTVQVTNGKGLLAKVVIKEIAKKSLKAEIVEETFMPRPEYRVACAFSLLKNKHDLLIVEKLTELGITDLFPMQTVNSVRISKQNTHEKFIKTAISAIKQCNNPWLPTIHQPQTLENTLKLVKELNYLPIIASEQKLNRTLKNTNISNSHHSTANTLNHCIIIGPEGGFDSTEFKIFIENNIPQISLSQNILRAETAAIVAVTQLLFQRLN